MTNNVTSTSKEDDFHFPLAVTWDSEPDAPRQAPISSVASSAIPVIDPFQDQGKTVQSLADRAQKAQKVPSSQKVQEAVDVFFSP